MEELFSGETGLRLTGAQEVAPNPNPQPHHHHHPTAFFHPQPHLIPAAGPQKLRPIRSNGGFHKLQDADAPPLINCSATASSSSDCSEKPRKKRKKIKMESFLQDLISQMIHKQEQMHHQLMDLFLTNENKRILREQHWRQQETERANRDHQIRAQEAARSLALISFIRNALGVPDVQIPNLDPLTIVESQEDNYNKRWPTSEVEALITLRAALDHKFHNSGAQTSVWEQVSAGMASMGFSRSAKKCKEKWENLNKYYRKAASNGNGDAKTCPYFHHLETLYRNRLITTSKPNTPELQMQSSTGM